MHVMYVHQNFPAQFGHIAAHLARTLKWRCTFVSQAPAGNSDGIERIQYTLAGGATRSNHFCSRTFENTVWHCDGVYRALRNRPEIRPDLIVGHSGFGSTLFLRELYPDVPVINFFEYYYIPHDPDSDMDFRRDLGWEIPEIKYLRSRCRNAMILLDLQNCQVGYTPTNFQRSKFPKEYQPKLRTIFDGVDRKVYHGHDEALRPPLAHRQPRRLAGVDIPPNTRVVTYVSRGFESMRGFDIFMRAAKLIYQQFPDVVFLVIGTDRIAYGGDESYTGGKSFKDWVLAQDNYDLEKIRFVGRVNPLDLARILASTDLHIYLTVPFVLSWSMMDAMSCGAVVLGSATSPVKEMIRDGENGLLADFFKPEQFAEKAVQVLRNPDEFRPLGRAAEKMIIEQYSLEAVLPKMLALYQEALQMPDEPARPIKVAATVMPGASPPRPAAVPPSRLLPAHNPNPDASRRSPFRG
jgi:glycosyltransferase involved in cell wall biosynthesis